MTDNNNELTPRKYVILMFLNNLSSEEIYKRLYLSFVTSSFDISLSQTKNLVNHYISDYLIHGIV